MTDPTVLFAATTLELPRGGRLTVREITPADANSLHALFAGLGVEARRRRFFAGGPPPRRVAEQMACVGQRDGFGLVAEFDADTPDARLVAEATCNHLDNGDGELGMTVADGWRGWLGPYLFDALVRTAADRGLANLEADVLADNGPMLAILRARGAVVMRRPDWTVVRLLVGTTDAGPVWPPGGSRPRVLVETPVASWHALEAVRRTGAEVLVCRGPAWSGRRCPALEGRPCPLAAEADLIVISRPSEDERWRALCPAHALVHRGVPVCLERRHGSLSPLSQANPVVASVREAMTAGTGR